FPDKGGSQESDEKIDGKNVTRADVDAAIQSDRQDGDHTRQRHRPFHPLSPLPGQHQTAGHQAEKSQRTLYAEGDRIENPETGQAAFAEQVGRVSAILMPLRLTDSVEKFRSRHAALK